MKAVLLALAVSSCAPTYALTAQAKPPTWLYAVDMAVMSVGFCAGLDGQYRAPHPQNRDQMAVGYGIAGAIWSSYWLPLEAL